MEIVVYSIEGKDTGRKVTLSEDVFGVEPNEHVVYLDVKQYLANQRQGTHKAKEKAEVSHSTRKIKKQKGTGGARAGSLKSPVFKGGGRVFGPRPRDYGFKLNKKVKILARKSVLSDKAKLGNIIALEEFNFDTPKTKAYLSLLNSLNLTTTKTLMVLNELSPNIVLSGRNVPKNKIVLANQLNTYDVINAQKIILSEKAIMTIENLLKAE